MIKRSAPRAFGDPYRLLRRDHKEFFRLLLLSDYPVTNDADPISPSAAPASPNLRLHARTHSAEEPPARPHHRQFTLQRFLQYDMLFDARKRQRDTPLVG
ncbi:MAG TPA: hypothetical protein VLX61_12735 [Anaerolineales bacterium]|nr:hypothetical protein [Anaerolineales bacterium]